MKHLFVVLALVGCSTTHPATASHTSTSGSEAPPPATADALTSAEIPNPCAEGRVRLTNGQGEYPSTIGLDTPSALELHPIATTDLDGDGRDELLAYVICMPGGSGTIDSIRAYRAEGNAFVEIAAIEGGDRADGGLDGGRVEGRDLFVGRYSGSETMCCPTHVTRETWRLENAHFVRTSVGTPEPVEH